MFIAQQSQAQTGGVGINTSTPEQMLDVAGAIKIANTTNPAIEGSIRYNTSTSEFEICTVNGIWTPLSGTN